MFEMRQKDVGSMVYSYYVRGVKGLSRRVPNIAEGLMSLRHGQNSKRDRVLTSLKRVATLFSIDLRM